MALTIRLTPARVLAVGDVVTEDILNDLGNPTVELDGTVGGATIGDDSITLPKLVVGILTADSSGRSRMVDKFVTAAKLNDTQDWTGKTLSGTPTVNWASATLTPPPGYLVQLARTNTATRQTVNTNIPLDNTSPLNTEGQLLLSQSITPKSATNILRVRATVPVFIPIQGYAVLALFNGTTCVAATRTGASNADSIADTAVIEYYVVAGGTSAITFNLRIGSANSASYSVYVNGDSTSGVFNGLSTAELAIEEITV